MHGNCCGSSSVCACHHVCLCVYVKITFTFELLMGDNLSYIHVEFLSPPCCCDQCMQPIADTYVSFWERTKYFRWLEGLLGNRWLFQDHGYTFSFDWAQGFHVTTQWNSLNFHFFLSVVSLCGRLWNSLVLSNSSSFYRNHFIETFLPQTLTWFICTFDI